MKKSFCTSCLLLIMILSANAQLIMNWDKRVLICPDEEEVTFAPLLTVGANWSFTGDEDRNFGTAAAPVAGSGKNIGVFGDFTVNPSYSQDSNFGVLGIVRQKTIHGRNYGLCGMIDTEYNPSNGAGIYATDCDYCYNFPHNLGGAYAAYFVGSGVHVTGNLTMTNMLTVSDSRICDNIVSLSRKSGTTTLQKLMNVDIVEYNQKARQFDEIPDGESPEKTEELRSELEYLKKEEQKMAARRHFGVDAQELQTVYPDLVLEGQDGRLSVNYLEMIPLVIRSIQELKEELDEVKRNVPLHSDGQRAGD